MGCGSSTPATKDASPVEQPARAGTTGAEHTNSKTAQHNNTSSDSTSVAKKKKTPLPTSGLVPIEFGLVKGLEYGDKTAPALLVVQARYHHSA